MGHRIVQYLLLIAPLAGALLLQPLTHARRTGRPVVCAISSVEALPEQPATELELDVVQTVTSVCEGLMHNDVPSQDSGITRLYHFLTPMGRCAIAPPPPKSGLQGGVTVEDFLRDAGSKALGALMFCQSYELVGEPVLTPGSITRGRIATQLIEVGNCPLEATGDDLAGGLKKLVGASDDYLEAIIASVRDGADMPSTPDSVQVKERFWVQLEEERRPPLQNCWLIKEFLPLKKSVFQALNEGGEEFEGDDS